MAEIYLTVRFSGLTTGLQLLTKRSRVVMHPMYLQYLASSNLTWDIFEQHRNTQVEDVDEGMMSAVDTLLQPFYSCSVERFEAQVSIK